MAGGDDGNRPGGIRGLVHLVERHGEAIEADLIALGLRLRDCPSPEFNWRDLYVICNTSDPNTKLYGSLYPDKAGFDRQGLLLGLAVDALNWLVWAKTKDGHKGRNRPKSVLPGQKKKFGQHRPGAAPRPSPLSVIKARLGVRVQGSEDERKSKMGKLFGRR